MRWWSLISGFIAPHCLKSCDLVVSITSSNVSDVGVILVGLVIKHCRWCNSSRSNRIFPSLRSGRSLSKFRSPVMTIACFLREAHIQISRSRVWALYRYRAHIRDWALGWLDTGANESVRVHGRRMRVRTRFDGSTWESRKVWVSESAWAWVDESP